MEACGTAQRYARDTLPDTVSEQDIKSWRSQYERVWLASWTRESPREDTLRAIAGVLDCDDAKARCTAFLNGDVNPSRSCDCDGCDRLGWMLGDLNSSFQEENPSLNFLANSCQDACTEGELTQEQAGAVADALASWDNIVQTLRDHADAEKELHDK